MYKKLHEVERYDVHEQVDGAANGAFFRVNFRIELMEKCGDTLVTVRKASSQAVAKTEAAAKKKARKQVLEMLNLEE